MQEEMRVGSLEIDVGKKLVTRNGEPVHLTRTEWQLLRHLSAHPGKVIANTDILVNVWGPQYRDDLQYLRVWVSRLRRKLEADPGHPQLIKTKQGIGYLFDGPAQAPASIAS